MVARSPRARRLRFALPAVAAGAIGLAAWLPTVTAGASTPDLPAATAQQVVARALAARVPGLSGTVRWTADLGIPDLGSLAAGQGDNAFSPTALLSGSHTIDVWDAGADRQRLALPGSLSEVDVVRAGQQAWYYDSGADTVTHLVAGTPAAGPADPAAAPDAETPLTPDAIAARLLSHLSPSTTVTVASPVYVAGRPTYQVMLSPAPGTAGATASTVRAVSIAVDAATGVPLQVEVDAKGQSSPALKIAFTSVDFSVPAASTFAPLTGTTVKTRVVNDPTSQPAGSRPPATDTNRTDAPTLIGAAWGQVLDVPANGRVASGRTARQLQEASTRVTGAFGTGQLLQTSLLNVLLLPDGRALLGFVTPTALEAAAGAATP